MLDKVLKSFTLVSCTKVLSTLVLLLPAGPNQLLSLPLSSPAPFQPAPASSTSSSSNPTSVLISFCLRLHCATLRSRSRRRDLTPLHWIMYGTSVAKDKYLAITYHYADKDLNTRARVLDLVQVEGNSTALLTSALVEQRLERYFELVRPVFK